MNPPPDRTLPPGEVHIWKIPLPSTLASLSNLPTLLSPPERDRAARFTFEKDQARFISCRANLRQILARYTGLPAADIVFAYEPHGKPLLTGAPGWQFNVSHSRDLAAIAISRYDRVGIDIELIDPKFPRNDVAPDILSPDELRDLAALPRADQPRYFFQLWTLKEALLKANGGGLSLDPREICIRLDDTLHPQIISAPPDFIHATLTLFTLHDGYAAALAALARVTHLSFFSV